MDKEVFDIINQISNEHSNNTFGYLTKDDLKNEIWQICLEKIEDFNKSSGDLEHFLRVVVKNRLINRFKDLTKSVRSPCPRCPFYDPKVSPSDCAKFGDDRHLCKKWKNYQLSIESRNSLLNSAEPQLERYKEERVLDKMIGVELNKELLSKIDVMYHRDLNELMGGAVLSKQKLKKLKKEIQRVLEIPKL